MSAHLLPLATPPAELAAEPTAGLSAAQLIAGPCALPHAPLAMPAQVIEPQTGLLRRLFGGLMPHHPAAPSAGAGL